MTNPIKVRLYGRGCVKSPQYTNACKFLKLLPSFIPHCKVVESDRFVCLEWLDNLDNTIVVRIDDRGIDVVCRIGETEFRNALEGIKVTEEIIHYFELLYPHTN